MKALTIAQPWTELIASGVKRIENRTWFTHYRGPLAIHAAKSRTWLDREDPQDWLCRYGIILPDVEALTFGAFVAVVDLIDCVRIEQLSIDLQNHAFAEGPFCWLLRDVCRIEPVPCLGRQGLWTPPAQMMPKLLAASVLAAPTN